MVRSVSFIYFSGCAFSLREYSFPDVTECLQPSRQYKDIGAENRHPLKGVLVVLLQIHLLHLSKENIVPLKEEGNPRNPSQLATRRLNYICQMFKGGLVTHGLEMLCCQY